MAHVRTLILPLAVLVSACGPKPPATCEPKTCSILGVNCGQVSDGCSGTLECGLCAEPETCGGAGQANLCGVGLPPDPKTLAPGLDPTVPSDFADSLDFLYRGDRPIQLGVKDGTIDKLRIGWLRGKVTSPDGKPLPASPSTSWAIRSSAAPSLAPTASSISW